MAVTLRDKKIDVELDKIVLRLRNDFGIKNASKTDAIRFLLRIRRQGKKTNYNWGMLFDE